ncbi:hypothetical protein Tco_0764698 [Tanacetum coccineum]
MYETRQTTILFPSHLNGYYCEEKKGSNGPQFSEAHSEASHINNSIPRKEKDPRSEIDDYPSYCDYDKKIHIDPRERNIDEYWWRIYKSGDLEVLES